MKIKSSGKFTFQSVRAERLIREAFELIGLSNSEVPLERFDGALSSLNFLLLDLANRNINLWTIKEIVIPLINGQSSYILPAELIKVIQIELRTSLRNLNGSPFASEGDAASAFDNNLVTACTQNTAKGNIGFTFDLAANITVLGINSLTTQDYTIVLEGSNNIANNNGYVPILTIPITTYQAGITQWFNFVNINNYAHYRIRENGNGILNIAELYFNDSIVDYPLTEISDYSYRKMPIKNMGGRPTIYSVDYQMIPILNMWQTPQEQYNQYNLLVMSYQSMIETLESYTESLNVPNSFYQAIIYGLAEALAMKYAPDKSELMNAKFEATLDRALVKNTNTLPLSFKFYAN